MNNAKTSHDVKHKYRAIKVLELLSEIYNLDITYDFLYFCHSVSYKIQTINLRIQTFYAICYFKVYSI